jgi:molybdopterin molybdotransferase
MGTDGMLALVEARRRLLETAVPLAPERASLADSAGRTLAEDVRASRPLPSFDASAMDGYAVRVADLGGGGPWRLPLRGESRAGRVAEALAPGAACRIFTGAIVPEGADAVIMQEQVTRAGDEVVFDRMPSPGQHIRRRGEDIAAGSVAIPRGSRVSAGAIALAAMFDRTEIVVARRPRVTILCTGDELRPAGSPEDPATIPESNSLALQALARRAAADVRIAPIVRDEPEETALAIERALEGSDVLVTVGGVSVGDHDVVRQALDRAGVALDFWRVAIKPGKPLAVGRRGQSQIVLGLPGNPASALVTFALFGMPLLRSLQGDARPLPTTLRGVLAKARKRPVDRLELVRATLERDGDALVVAPHDNQSSGAATSLAASDGLAFLAPGQGALEAGAAVDFVAWDDF